jgi:HAD superfamily hydrolase (TIGR01509 family)
MDELQAHHKYIEQHEMRVIEGVPDLLASLSNAGIPFGVASNSSLGSLKNKLNLLGLYPLFEPHIFSKDMVSNPKPAPDLFLHAGRTMLGDDFDPACCAVVEDSIPGATAGVAAHMHVFGYAGGTHRLKNYDQELLQVGVKQAFHSMRDIQREIHILNLAMQAGAGMALKVGPLPSGP